MKESKIGLGTVQFGMTYGISNKGTQTSPEEVSEILDIAHKSGIRVLDSASAYGDAEKVVGKNDLQNYKVVSKFLPPGSGKRIYEQLSCSLHHLGVEKLYGYLAHRPIDLLKNPCQWQELQDFKNKGLVQKIGYSLNTLKELKDLLKAGFYPDLIQAPYNYFDRRFEQDFKSLKKKNIEIHTRSAFLQGLFFMDPEELDNFFAEIFDVLKELQIKCNHLPGALLNFVVNKPFIDHVIIGVNNKNQLLQNIKGLNQPYDLPILRRKIANDILIPSKWPK